MQFYFERTDRKGEKKLFVFCLSFKMNVWLMSDNSFVSQLDKTRGLNLTQIKYMHSEMPSVEN